MSDDLKQAERGGERGRFIQKLIIKIRSRSKRRLNDQTGREGRTKRWKIGK